MALLSTVLRNPFKLVVGSSVSGEICFHKGFSKYFFKSKIYSSRKEKELANNVTLVETMQSGIICSAKGHSNKIKQCTHTV